MMCMEMGWTTELGQAFVADQAGVLDAIQRLRRQAMDVGNLQSSEAMLVETTEQEGKEVVVLKPPKPEVVYVPTYDPQTAYAPVPGGHDDVHRDDDRGQGPQHRLDDRDRRARVRCRHPRQRDLRRR